ncbi:MAG: hypothetical protein KME10_16535 [Plectolyngbya sp. WJT66-NPBG17]|jgi:ADP-heptose:LPS heptosyltransferase|nr:hypothetical protein [Plectolyngbya sp. WJT66-NPBG17]MBW4527376.1 hypothetical protein [Phormidium tanganyikae FI6-MK23]
MLHEQKILVIQPGNDAEALRSRIKTVRSRFPNSQIVVLCAASLSRAEIAQVNQVLVHCTMSETGLSDVPERLLSLIELLKIEQFDLAIVLPDENRSPYPFAYVCYFAEIPVRIGISCEFGGGVLSQCGTNFEELIDCVQGAA